MNESDSPAQASSSARREGSAGDRALSRFLRTQLRPYLDPDDARILRAVVSAIVRGDLAPLHQLSAREKRSLLEMLDGRLSVHRRMPDPRSLVRLTDALVPPLPGEERLRAPGAPAR